MKDWKLMIMLNSSKENSPVYVRYDSPKMITVRYLTGCAEQKKKGYIDYPYLTTPYKARLSGYELKEPSADDLNRYLPVLEVALKVA